MRAWLLILGLALLMAGCAVWSPLYGYRPERLGLLQPEELKESSGLEESVRYSGWLWSINDSGNAPVLFCIDQTGSVPQAVGDAKMSGQIVVEGATNTDWESLTMDDAGRLYIGDIGNNANARQDLHLLRLQEPDPLTMTSVRPEAVFDFRFPDQKAFPASLRNFDCEGLFWMHGRMYALTKHRDDTHTKLYRFPELREGEVLELDLLEEVEIGEMVTAADADSDRGLLAVLTYDAIWLFRSPTPEVSLLGEGLRKLSLDRYKTEQCEAVVIVGDAVLLTNEQRSLMRIPFDAMEPAPALKNLLLP